MRRIRARGATGGGTSFGGARLVSPGVLTSSGLTTFTRAQAGGITAMTLASDGVTWSEVAADVPRFFGTDAGLLIEGERTNNVRNARPNLTVTPPTTNRPTNWTNINTAGYAANYVSTQTTSGMPTVRVEIAGVASGTIYGQSFDTTTGIAAVSGDVVHGRVYVRLESASAPPLTYFIRLIARDSGGTAIGGGTTTQNYTPTSTLTAVSVSATMPASTAFVTLEWGATLTAAASYNFVQDFGAPQLGVGVTFLSSPILNPASTSSVANVRGADALTGVVSTLFPSNVGTVLAKVVIPQNAPTGLDQTIIQIDDGTANNRVRLRNVAAGATVVLGRVVSGTPNDATSLGSMTAGTAFKVGFTFDGTNISGNLNGGTTQSITGSIAGLSNFRVGLATGGASALFGRVLYLDVLPYAVPDLATSVSGLP